MFFTTKTTFPNCYLTIIQTEYSEIYNEEFKREIERAVLNEENMVIMD